MSGLEVPRGDHIENPAEAALPPKRSTICNILKSFHPPSLKSIRGHQQVHGVKGCGEGTSVSDNEGRTSSEGMQNVVVSDDKHSSESNLEMNSQGDERRGEGGVSEAASQQCNPKVPSQAEEEREKSPELPDQGEDGEQKEGGAAIYSNINSDLKLPSQKEEEKEVGGEDDITIASQCEVDNQNKSKLPKPTLGTIDKVKDNLETVSTEMDDKPVTHTFSFHLSSPQESQPDSSSESHPLTTSILSTQQPQPGPSKPRTKSKRQKGLSTTKDGKDSDSSVCSRKRSSKSKTKIKSKFAPGSLEYIEERLCGRIFSGWVEERQWVEAVGGYRDVIEVDEWEMEMNHILQAIISSIPGVQERTRWINITPPDKNPYYCLWVLLAAPPTPGHYWYTITGTKLQPQFGLMISVKEIRSIHPHDGELAAARRQRIKKKSQGAAQTDLESVNEVLQDWLDQCTSLRPTSVLSSITSTFTLTNIKEAIRFLIVLLMTLVIGLVTFVRGLHVVGLQFIREAGIFFHNATPFLQTLLGFFEKIVGGLYLLMAMVYRDFRRPSVPPPRFPPPPPQPLTPSPPRPPTGPRAIQYVSPERWVIKTQNNLT